MGSNYVFSRRFFGIACEGLVKKLLAFVVVLLSVSLLHADISVTDRASTLRLLAEGPATKPGAAPETRAERMARRAATRAANQAKRAAQRSRHAGKVQQLAAGKKPGRPVSAIPPTPLIDAGGLQYFVNTDVTNSTTSNASGAASEASYQAPIVASTVSGGTTTSSLNDMFDGYNSLCVSLTGGTGPCATGDPAYTFYSGNGPTPFDATVPATPECTNRQLAFPAQIIGPLSVSRKVFVPTNDQFIRWVDSFTNTSGAPVTFNALTANNLGSDSNTIIVSSSNGDAVAQTTDTWVSTFQNFTPTTSSDPRIGHVLQGTGAPTPLSLIFFANGNDNPFWGYTITLAPGETKLIMNFATGLGTKAAANAQAARLALLPDTTLQCLSTTELGQITNFAVAADLAITKTSTPATTVNAGQPFTYTLAVTNNGPAPATSVSVSDTLPAGVGFVDATGTGWTCSQTAGTVTCTMATLAVGAASPITITVTAPNDAAVLSNTATVSSATTDPTPANNTSTVTLTVAPVADLSITKTSAPAGSVNAGQNVTYTLQVNNAGPSTATSVSVTDTLPPTAQFVSAGGAGWTCVPSAGAVTCTMAALAVGPASPITVIVTAPNTATALTNTATVSSATTDPVPANNTSTNLVTTVAIADLSIVKSASAASAFGGLNVTYTLAVSNLGPTVASTVTVTDVLPAGSTFVSAAGAGWTCTATGGTVTCSQPTLAVGAAAPITLVIKAPAAPAATAPGTLVNTATITSVTPDPVPGNNSSTVSQPLQPGAAIPTLSFWMLIALAAVLGLAGALSRR
jgi:uncharacterized repeat protein (TIGR01451 family)